MLKPLSEFVDPLAYTSKTLTNASNERNDEVGASAEVQMMGGVAKSVLRKIYSYDESCNVNRRGDETP